MPSILIVDDEEDIRELIAVNLLREENYQLLEAVNGLDALEMAKKERPDLVILDLMLPGIPKRLVENCQKRDAP